MVRQVEKIWPPFIACAHCEVFQPPVLDRALSTFSRKKRSSENASRTRRDKNVSSCKTCPPCCILRKAKADAKAKASQPLRRGWQMKMTRLAIAWDHQDWPMVQWLCDSYHPELPTVEPNPNTSCLKKDPLAWIFWIRSHRGSLAWEKSLGLGFCKVSCGQTVVSHWYVLNSDAVLMKNGPTLQMVHGAATLYIRDVHAQGSTGKPEEATAGICSDL